MKSFNAMHNISIVVLMTIGTQAMARQGTIGAAPAATTPPATPSSHGVEDRPMSPDASQAGIGAPTASSNDPFEDAVDRLKQFHSIESPDGGFRVSSDFWLTQDFMVFDQPPPAFVQTGQSQIYWPAVSGLMSIEAGDHLSFVALGQAYRGFDPKDASLNANLDEYFAVIKPLDTNALIIKGGTFATCYGQWVNRHFSFQNPLINAPLMYEGLTNVTDGANGATATPTRAQFLNRKNVVNQVASWVPVIWGPSYTSGGQIGGTWQKFDYALELKNAGLSSRPSEWQFWNKDFSNPTLTGRIGFRPDAAWNLGLSGSGGSYTAANPTTTQALNAWDTTQTVLGTDISWAHGSLEVWGEFAWSQFRIPNLEPADTYTYFLETKWKFAQQFWLAGRWNQQMYGNFGSVTPPGGTTNWGNNLWRIDACVGWKIDRFAQFKVQYSFAHEDGFEQQASNLFALQLVVEF